MDDQTPPTADAEDPATPGAEQPGGAEAAVPPGEAPAAAPGEAVPAAVPGEAPAAAPGAPAEAQPESAASPVAPVEAPAAAPAVPAVGPGAASFDPDAPQVAPAAASFESDVRQVAPAEAQPGSTVPPVAPGTAFAAPAGLPVAPGSAFPAPEYSAPVEGAAVPVPAPRRRSRGAVVAIWLLAAALVLAVAAGAWLVVQFVQAQEQISEQEQQISDQKDEIEQQKELIDEKESFGAAMNGLMDTASKFDGVPMGSIVPWHEYQVLANRAWAHRWDARKISADTQQVELAAEKLETVWATAQQEASTNTTGSEYEAVIDRLGAGFVRSVIDANTCSNGDDGILGCVYQNDPYLVHFDAAGDAEPFMTDELRTGIAYHEFAHVLQFTNPAALDAVLPAFDDDFEVMADCFALTFLDGWKLDHRIWVSSYEYWDVSIGYGQVCSESQRQAVRDWYAQLGVEYRTLHAGDSPS